ncbi:hypothetical protein L6164_017752 [Bauhinia variegata]|uniref:Uncharacterized protein n=1 Tax=Bauhinia variegata TaxID=167791 RepID=A0ACB9N8S1_BAUVA|nr:hypothetical protein L6164_017752 [Bauhinia variegata]
MAQPIWYNQVCQNDTVAPSNSTYRSNLNLLLSTLSSKAATGGFGETTVGNGSGNSPTIYGEYSCRQDTSSVVCQYCVTTSAQEILTRCHNSVTAIIWYNYCMLRYSNVYFFGTVAMEPSYSYYNVSINGDDHGTIVKRIVEFMNGLVLNAIAAEAGMFAVNESDLSDSMKYYGFVQCVKDINGSECRRCLQGLLRKDGGDKVGVRLLCPSCAVRRETYRFLLANQANGSPSNSAGTGRSKFAAKWRIGVISITSLLSLTAILCCIYYMRKRCCKDELEPEKGLLFLPGHTQIEESLQADLPMMPLSAWRLWNEGKALILMDPLLENSHTPSEVSNCIHIALLCVQEDPEDRPTMPTVIVMLSSYTQIFPNPKQPAFSVGKEIIEQDSCVSKSNIHSMNEATISVMEPSQKNIASMARPIWYNQVCQNDTAAAPYNSTYQSNLNLLLSTLSSKAATDGFGETTVGNGSGNSPTIYGQYLCRPDTSSVVCQYCVTTSAQEILTRCPNSVTAIIWYNYCMLRYSNVYFFGTVAKEPSYNYYNVSIYGDEQGTVSKRIVEFMNGLILNATAAEPGMLSAANELDLSDSMKCYGLVQCVRDINGSECRRCLQGLLREDGGDRVGVSFLCPSCMMERETYRFLQANQANGSLNNSAGTGRNKFATKWRIGVISFASLLSLTAILCCIYYVRGRCCKATDEQEPEKGLLFLPGQTQSEDSLKADLPMMPLSVIQHCTNHFSDESKLGEGGFGPVYEAWRLWNEGKALILMDPLLENSHTPSEVSNCIHIALLCVQENPEDRPTMPTVIVMLSSDTQIFPNPKQPAFSVGKEIIEQKSCVSNSNIYSKNEATISAMEPR